ncbi:hypothetical protein MtrunA17_Chr3g0143631 [Medicago truncatula]|uniref:Transmembrane protein n=1 Tax=Medicago truncatula TaxID=3880 RepID=A0A396J2X3_MEDTR|nr:hypothetical protein MtrunA17_Chr3g0143631 [Medicago truncatula]
MVKSDKKSRFLPLLIIYFPFICKVDTFIIFFHFNLKVFPCNFL